MFRDRDNVSVTGFTPERGAERPDGGESRVTGGFIDFERQRSAEAVPPTRIDDDPGTMPDDEIMGENGVRPVVGWLVGIEGCIRGRAYSLHAGYNYIGRGKDAEIKLPDMKVDAKSATGWVNYTREDGSFNVGALPGAVNVMFVNGSKLLLSQSLPLAAYDRIKMGDSVMIFVPLCGEHFQWEV